MQLTQTLIDDHGATVIMVTHDMELVAQHATRVIVLDKGTILVDGTPMHVFNDARDILAKVSLKPPCIVELTRELNGDCQCMLSFKLAKENAVVQRPAH